MYIKFIIPFDVRNEMYTYNWILFRSVNNIKNLGLMAPPHYWESISERANETNWENHPSIREKYSYKLPSQDDLDRLAKFPLNSNCLAGVAEESIGPNIIWRRTIIERIPALEEEIERALENAGTVDAILAWTNCASLKVVARKREIPLIHQELGPLRPPYFRFTAYFDFEGVNGDTDASRRWRRFKAEAADVPMLSRDGLLEMLAMKRAKPNAAATHEAGIALQLADDSNTIAFGNGFNSFELIATTLRYMEGRPLVRPHPARGERIDGLPVDWDTSEHPAQFLDRVSSLVTINSSLALEAILVGKPTYILGDSPFKDASWDIINRTPAMSEEETLLWLNWFLFGYLIPYDLTFDPDYMAWRLTNPSEQVIYRDNFARWNS